MTQKNLFAGVIVKKSKRKLKVAGISTCATCGRDWCMDESCIDRTVRINLESGDYDLDPKSISGKHGIGRRNNV